MVHHVMGHDGYYPYLLALWLLPLARRDCELGVRAAAQTAAGPLGSAALGAAFVATVLSWAATRTQGGATSGAHQALFSWLPGFDFGLLLDPLSLLWALIITGVGFLIHVYSIGYMDGDNAFARFFAYLNFFVFAMLTLVLSDNFVGLLVGWGLVGLASYFLIGFWFFKPSAVAAARKAFVINVAGDVGIMFAIFMIFAQVHAIAFRRRVRSRGFMRRRVGSLPSASRSSSVRRRSRRRFRCIPGFPMQWKARRRFPR